MGHVAVGEHDLVDLLFAADLFQPAILQDWDALRIGRAGQGRWIAAAGDARNLCRGKGDDLISRIVAQDHVEVVEVPASRSHDEAPALGD
jgi:hypothetical protein